MRNAAFNTFRGYADVNPDEASSACVARKAQVERTGFIENGLDFESVMHPVPIAVR